MSDQEGEEEMEDIAQLSLITRRVLRTHMKEENLENQRENLFHICCLVQTVPCSIVIDSGSCTNVVSSSMISRLGLDTTTHPQPYKLQWLNDCWKFQSD